MCDPMAQFCALPGRVILDTCIINLLQDQGEYIWDGVDPEGASKYGIDPDLMALRAILQVNQRAMFQFVISPLTLAEVANTQDLPERERRVRWVLDILDHWLVMLDDIEDRTSQGGTVRSRFKLS
ncbi:MAG: hypothetical protein M1370_06860, partial [Bacteroidetes bacterium]|nr:hypothetical protein [Bacteroidota bacterium]